MLNVFVEEALESVVLRCAGSLVLGDEAAILCPAIGHRGKEIFLDLSLVDRIDAAGIGALISLQASGIYLKIADPSKSVADLLQLTHVNSLFEIVHGSVPDGTSSDAIPTHRSFPSTLPASA